MERAVCGGGRSGEAALAWRGGALLLRHIGRDLGLARARDGGKGENSVRGGGVDANAVPASRRLEEARSRAQAQASRGRVYLG